MKKTHPSSLRSASPSHGFRPPIVVFRPLRRKRSRKCLDSFTQSGWLLRSSELKLTPQPIEVCHSDNQPPPVVSFLFFRKKVVEFFFLVQRGGTHQLPHYWYCRSHPKKKEIQYFRCLKRSRKNHYMTPGPQTSYTKVRGKSLQMTGATFATTSLIYKAKSIRISGNMKS